MRSKITRYCTMKQWGFDNPEFYPIGLIVTLREYKAHQVLEIKYLNNLTVRYTVPKQMVEDLISKGSLVKLIDVFEMGATEI